MGGRAFCSGGDVAGVAKAFHSGNHAVVHEFFRIEYQLEHYIASILKPTIALTDGVVMGGGVGLSVHNR